MGHGYKAKCDYVELTVEQHDGAWRVTLHDVKHQEDVVHEDEFPSADEAQDAAVELATRHINIEHNDTLIYPQKISWREY